MILGAKSVNNHEKRKDAIEIGNRSTCNKYFHDTWEHRHIFVILPIGFLAQLLLPSPNAMASMMIYEVLKLKNPNLDVQIRALFPLLGNLMITLYWNLEN